MFVFNFVCVCVYIYIRYRTSDGRDCLVDCIRIGAQLGTEVTLETRWTKPASPAIVSQAYCSAISCAYSGLSNEKWAPLAKIVLDGAYEATLLAAALDVAQGRGSGVVFLTMLGGGVFGNSDEWIAAAIARAVHRARDLALTVKVCHFRSINANVVSMVETHLERLRAPGD
jgi:hypothetical protein